MQGRLPFDAHQTEHAIVGDHPTEPERAEDRDRLRGDEEWDHASGALG